MMIITNKYDILATKIHKILTMLALCMLMHRRSHAHCRAAAFCRGMRIYKMFIDKVSNIQVVHRLKYMGHMTNKIIMKFYQIC